MASKGKRRNTNAAHMENLDTQLSDYEVEEAINHIEQKNNFLKALKLFATSLANEISVNGEWTVKGFIDIFKNIYTISCDTKIVSKILELHLFPSFTKFAENIGYNIELASHQNYYPDLTFISKENSDIKFAVDLKTTYMDDDYPGFCNGFTLGSHGEYFVDRTSTKNIQYPYNQYLGHFCLGIIYSRAPLDEIDETRLYSIDELKKIPSVARNFIFFAEEKWKIASDKGGSGNTANIGSIQKVSDILAGNGVFSRAGEAFFDDYWANFGKLQIQIPETGKYKTLSSFKEYLQYRGLPVDELYTPKAPKKKS